MDKKQEKNSRLKEIGKDILIVTLTCTAIYLGADTLVVGGLSGLLQQSEDTGSYVVTQREPSSVAWPVRMAISSWNGGSMLRYGVQYDREESENQFQPVASLLREALSSPGAAQSVTVREWHKALSNTSNLYFDLLGDVPLSVLGGWLSGSEYQLEGTVRRLVLSTDGQRVNLYYQDSVTGHYYVRQADVISPEQVMAVTSMVMGNGAIFAFEQEAYDGLDGNTLLLPEQPQPRVYQGSNPLEGDRNAETVLPNSNLERLLLALSFPENSYIYPGTDQVIRSGNDTLRVSADGVVRYSVAEGETSRYLVQTQSELPTAFEAAEACRRLADGAAGDLAGAARLYLKEISQTQEGWQVNFAYCLDGANVLVGEDGYAAHFVVEGAEITQFTLQMRSYADTGERSIVLPEQQAMAAMESLGKRGSSLVLAYRDSGTDQVSAVWTAE